MAARHNNPHIDIEVARQVIEKRRRLRMSSDDVRQLMGQGDAEGSPLRRAFA